MYQYCQREFRMSEDVAYKRIQAARATRRYPQILDGIADGQLNLTTIVVLRKHLTRRNADRHLKAVEYATKAEVLFLIAREFPKPDVPTRIEPVMPAPIGLRSRTNWFRNQLSLAEKTRESRNLSRYRTVRDVLRTAARAPAARLGNAKRENSSRCVTVSSA